MHGELAELPRPRKHYQWYYSTREANNDMHRAPQGVHDFLRAYYHMIGCHLVDGAGHWVQQERPGEVSRLLLAFLRDAHGGA